MFFFENVTTDLPEHIRLFKTSPNESGVTPPKKKTKPETKSRHQRPYWSFSWCHLAPDLDQTVHWRTLTSPQEPQTLLQEQVTGLVWGGRLRTKKHLPQIQMISQYVHVFFVGHVYLTLSECSQQTFSGDLMARLLLGLLSILPEAENHKNSNTPIETLVWEQPHRFYRFSRSKRWFLGVFPKNHF